MKVCGVCGIILQGLCEVCVTQYANFKGLWGLCDLLYKRNNLYAGL